jgi:hypothetical protein
VEVLLRDQQHLTAQLQQHAVTHQHLLALTLDLRQLSTGVSGSVGAGRRGRGLSPAAFEGALRAVRDAATALLTADLLGCPLTVEELTGTLGLLLDPTATSCGPLPASTRQDWDRGRTDDTLHRCYAVTGWPRLPLTADWLTPLLHAPLPPGTARTLSVHTRPVAPAPAARRARASSAKARLDASDRSRLGLTGPDHSRLGDTLAEADADATEAELAAGYRLTDLSVLLAVSAAEPAALEQGCRQLRTDAATSRLGLRPLHGQHLTALASVLPLGLHPGAVS